MLFSIAVGVTDERAKIKLLMRDVDRTLLRENLKLTPAQRLEKFANFMRFASHLKEAGAARREIKAKAALKR